MRKPVKMWAAWDTTIDRPIVETMRNDKDRARIERAQWVMPELWRKCPIVRVEVRVISKRKPTRRTSKPTERS